VLAIGLIAVASPREVMAASKVIWAKPGSSGEAMEAQFADCAKQAKLERYHPEPNPVLNGPLGIMFSDWFETKLYSSGVQANAAARCMFRSGYRPIRLTADEQAEAERQKEALQEWVDGFYARPDFARRLADANPPPLPDAPPEPFTYGPVRFDPESLRASIGVVGPGGALVSGKVGYRRIARLIADVGVGLGGSGSVPTGALLHQAVFQAEQGSERTYWCGPYRVTGFTLQACARNDPDGYVLFFAQGAPWLATDLDLGEATATTTDVYRIEQAEAAAPSASLGFVLVLKKLAAASLVVEAQVDNGHDGETLWKRTLSTDGDGRTVLPFWSYRIVITRTGAGVTAALTKDGDGQGPKYEPLR
jgi:hypothetical protein